MNDRIPEFMKCALQKAQESFDRGGFPAGAILVKDGVIAGEGISDGVITHDPTRHGDIVAIRAAAAELKNTSLEGCVLYTAIQPCGMCLMAAGYASITKVFYACSQKNLSQDYYLGMEDTRTLARGLMPPITMVHVREFEEEALNIVRRWERTLS